MSLRMEIDTQKQLLIQQGKLAQMGAMIDTIAHQWKQPLHQINSILPAMERHYAEQTLTPDGLASSLDEIEMLTTHMAQTVDRFREFFHAPDSPESFDVAYAVTSALTLIQSDLERHSIHCVFNSGGDYRVRGVKEDFVQAILTILSNAKECFLHRAVGTPKLRIDIGQNGSDVTVRLSDNAGGIPSEYLNKIFDLYFTTKFHGHGTGLGLYIAKLLIEKGMQGTITAENDTQGAVFTIFLPYVGAAQ